MRTIRELLMAAAVALSASIMAAPPAGAGTLSVTADSLSVLVGTWSGKVESQFVSGKRRGQVSFESDMTLEVEEGPELKGTFTMLARDNSWPTDVKAADGKVLMTVNRETQQFTLEEDSGHYTLRAEYETLHQAERRRTVLVLRK